MRFAQIAGYGGAGGIEFRSAMARLAEQHNTRIGEDIKEGAELQGMLRIGKGRDRVANGAGNFDGAFRREIHSVHRSLRG